MLPLALGAIPVAAFAQEAGTPAAPVIVPSSGASADQWYTGAPGQFTWALPDDVTAVAVELGDEPDHEPMFVYEPPIRGYTPAAADLHEGVQYLAVQFQNAAGWGAITRYPIRIDRTPPTNLFTDIVDQTPATSTLVFGANDAHSGIAGYAIHVNGTVSHYLTADEAQQGFSFTHPAPGRFDVQVVAYDQAGNTMANRFPVYVLDQSPQPNELWFGAFTDTEMLLLTLSILSLWLFVKIIRLKRYHRTRVRRIREEMYEVQEQMAKIFAALRDEIRDQVQRIRSKKRMTKGEQQVVEDLDKVLEVSETLVEKEVKDVKKLLS